MPGGARRDVENPSAVALTHAWQHALGQFERRRDQDFEHQLEVALVENGDRLEVRDCCVVDEDVNWTELTFDGFDESGTVVFAGQIGWYGDCFATGFGDCSHGAADAAG